MDPITLPDFATGDGVPADLWASIIERRAQLAGWRMALDDATDGSEEDTTDDTDEEDATDDDSDDDGEKKPAKFVDDAGKTWDFPARTPVSQMTDAEAREYWKQKAKKHESRNKAITERKKTAPKDNSGDDDGDSRKNTADDADERAFQRYGKSAVKAEFRAAFGERRTRDQIDTILAPLDLRQFLDDSGDVDTDKVVQYADSIAPASKRGRDGNNGPDMGQGRRGTGRPSKAAAGLAEAQRRFPKKS